MTNRTCASLATLEGVKLDCTAELIRAIWKAPNRAAVESLYPDAATIDSDWINPAQPEQLRREAINEAAGFHGVQYLGHCTRTGWPIHILDAGDPYAPTLCFIGYRLSVTTHADIDNSGRIGGQQ